MEVPMVDCDFFEVIEWDEESGEIYNAVCMMPSPCWPNCNRCQDRAEYRDIREKSDVAYSTVRMQRWINGKHYILTQSDIDVLSGSRNRRVRIADMDDVEVKNLYDMWKRL